MIPKTIHYCWFGRGKLPELAQKCIESWKRFLPGYEIKEWNEDNFNINIIPYTKEAYKCKKYAFVSDYARFWILYYYGGIYFDTDVEVIRPLDNIISEGSFMGFENNGILMKEDFVDNTLGVNPGLGLGTIPGLNLYKEILDHYEKAHFLNNDGSLNYETVVERVTGILVNHGLVKRNVLQRMGDITIYPYEYFCPIRITDGKKMITDKTYTIHHYAASWTSPTHRFLRKIVLSLGGVRLKLWLSHHLGFMLNN